MISVKARLSEAPGEYQKIPVISPFGTCGRVSALSAELI
jgi:hypothetical protein